MAVKTITIDIEAYDILARHKAGGQSFSQVIKQHFGRQLTVGRFLERTRGLRVSREALDAMENVVRARRHDRRRAPTL